VRYSFGNCCLDVDRRELHRGGDLVIVEPGVFDLLHFLVRNRDRVLSKDDLIANVWQGRAISDSALTSRMTLVRQAIGDSGEEQRLIRTIARKGFRFVGEVAASEPGAASIMPGAGTSATPTKILLIDDHALIREALHGVLKRLKEHAAIIEAGSAHAAMQCIAANPEIELILLDLKLPDRDGFELLAELRERHPAISLVVLSASEERDDVTRALDLGALGFIPKSATREVMVSALGLIFAGGIYVPPEILARTRQGVTPSRERE
jgi:DNA-binding response OmpR family regulator